MVLTFQKLCASSLTIAWCCSDSISTDFVAQRFPNGEVQPTNATHLQVWRPRPVPAPSCSTPPSPRDRKHTGLPASRTSSGSPYLGIMRAAPKCRDQ